MPVAVNVATGSALTAGRNAERNDLSADVRSSKSIGVHSSRPLSQAGCHCSGAHVARHRRASSAGHVLVWRPDAPDHGSTELGFHHSSVWDVAVFADGRVARGGDDRRLLIWDPVASGRSPAELSRDIWVNSLTTLAGGWLSAGKDVRVLPWDPAARNRHSTSFVELLGYPCGTAVRVDVFRRSAPMSQAMLQAPQTACPDRCSSEYRRGSPWVPSRSLSRLSAAGWSPGWGT